MLLTEFKLSINVVGQTHGLNGTDFILIPIKIRLLQLQQWKQPAYRLLQHRKHLVHRLLQLRQKV